MEKKRTASSGKNSREYGTALPRFRGMNEHALTVLEFHRALEQVAGRATSEAGRAAVLSLRPHSDREWVERELTASLRDGGLSGGTLNVGTPRNP